METAHEIRAQLLNAVNGPSEHIYVDLTAVTFMDSFALGVLLSGWKRAISRGMTLTISEPVGQVYQALRLMGLLSALRHEPPAAASASSWNDQAPPHPK